MEHELCWRMKHCRQRAVRTGPWKYLAVGDHEYLFAVRTDARERANLAHRQPERLARMKARHAQWEAAMPPSPEDAAVTLMHTERDTPQGRGQRP